MLKFLSLLAFSDWARAIEDEHITKNMARKNACVMRGETNGMKDCDFMVVVLVKCDRLRYLVEGIKKGDLQEKK